MQKTVPERAGPVTAHCFAVICLALALLLLARPAAAQGRDSLLNGAVVGAAVGAEWVLPLPTLSAIPTWVPVSMRAARSSSARSAPALVSESMRC